MKLIILFPVLFLFRGTHGIAPSSPIRRHCIYFRPSRFEEMRVDARIFPDIRDWLGRVVSEIEKELSAPDFPDDLCPAWNDWSGALMDVVMPRKGLGHLEAFRELFVALSGLIGVPYLDHDSDEGSTDGEDSVASDKRSGLLEIQETAILQAQYANAEMGMHFGEAAFMWLSAYAMGYGRSFPGAISGYLHSLRKYRKRHPLKSSRLVFPPSFVLRSLSDTLQQSTDYPVTSFSEDYPFTLPLEPYAERMISFLTSLKRERAPIARVAPVWIWKDGGRLRPYTRLIKQFLTPEYVEHLWERRGITSRFEDMVSQIYVLAAIGVIGSDDFDNISALLREISGSDVDIELRYDPLVEYINHKLVE